jgi:hypothetical protein
MFRRMKNALYSSAGVPPAFTLTTNRTSGTTVEALRSQAAGKVVQQPSAADVPSYERRTLQAGVSPAFTLTANNAPP